MTRMIGPWGAIGAQFLRMSKTSRMAVDMAVRGEAMLFSRYVNKAFTKGGYGRPWRRLNPITLALRKAGFGGGKSGGSKPLVRSGTLRKSIKVERSSYASYFVGVRRGSASGFNVAALHETGPHVIPITDKMRRFFLALYWKGILPFPWPPASKKYIVIPRRSFLEDTFKKFAPETPKRIAKRYMSLLMGKKFVNPRPT